MSSSLRNRSTNGTGSFGPWIENTLHYSLTTLDPEIGAINSSNFNSNNDKRISDDPSQSTDKLSDGNSGSVDSPELFQLHFKARIVQVKESVFPSSSGIEDCASASYQPPYFIIHDSVYCIPVFYPPISIENNKYRNPPPRYSLIQLRNYSMSTLSLSIGKHSIEKNHPLRNHKLCLQLQDIEKDITILDSGGSTMGLLRTEYSLSSRTSHNLIECHNSILLRQDLQLPRFKWTRNLVFRCLATQARRINGQQSIPDSNSKSSFTRALIPPPPSQPSSQIMTIDLVIQTIMKSLHNNHCQIFNIPLSPSMYAYGEESSEEKALLSIIDQVVKEKRSKSQKTQDFDSTSVHQQLTNIIQQFNENEIHQNISIEVVTKMLCRFIISIQQQSNQQQDSNDNDPKLSLELLSENQYESFIHFIIPSITSFLHKHITGENEDKGFSGIEIDSIQNKNSNFISSIFGLFARLTSLIQIIDSMKQEYSESNCDIDDVDNVDDDGTFGISELVHHVLFLILTLCFQSIQISIILQSIIRLGNNEEKCTNVDSNIEDEKRRLVCLCRGWMNKSYGITRDNHNNQNHRIMTDINSDMSFPFMKEIRYKVGQFGLYNIKSITEKDNTNQHSQELISKTGTVSFSSCLPPPPLPPTTTTNDPTDKDNNNIRDKNIQKRNRNRRRRLKRKNLKMKAQEQERELFLIETPELGVSPLETQPPISPFNLSPYNMNMNFSYLECHDNNKDELLNLTTTTTRVNTTSAKGEKENENNTTFSQQCQVSEKHHTDEDPYINDEEDTQNRDGVVMSDEAEIVGISEMLQTQEESNLDFTQRRSSPDSDDEESFNGQTEKSPGDRDVNDEIPEFPQTQLPFTDSDSEEDVVEGQNEKSSEKRNNNVNVSNNGNGKIHRSFPSRDDRSENDGDDDNTSRTSSNATNQFAPTELYEKFLTSSPPSAEATSLKNNNSVINPTTRSTKGFNGPGSLVLEVCIIDSPPPPPPPLPPPLPPPPHRLRHNGSEEKTIEKVAEDFFDSNSTIEGIVETRSIDTLDLFSAASSCTKPPSFVAQTENGIDKDVNHHRGDKIRNTTNRSPAAAIASSSSSSKATNRGVLSNHHSTQKRSKGKTVVKKGTTGIRKQKSKASNNVLRPEEHNSSNTSSTRRSRNQRLETKPSYNKPLEKRKRVPLRQLMREMREEEKEGTTEKKKPSKKRKRVPLRQLMREMREAEATKEKSPKMNKRK